MAVFNITFGGVLAKGMKQAAMKTWLEVYNQYLSVKSESARLSMKEEELRDQLRAIASSYTQLTDDRLPLTPEQEILTRTTQSLGDVLEAMLKERGPLEKSAVQDELIKTGRITGKNARIVLANAITRDQKKRFKVANGIVQLKRKADAKG